MLVLFLRLVFGFTLGFWYTATLAVYCTLVKRIRVWRSI